MRQIVVGIDGSESSTNALRWAAEEAATRDARLVAIHAWHVPASAYGGLHARYVDSGVYEAAAAEVLRKAMAAVDVTSVRRGVDERLLRSDPAAALLEAAGDGDVIVLGASRRRALGDLLLGSTARDVTRRATTPVVVVPAEATATSAAA